MLSTQAIHVQKSQQATQFMRYIMIKNTLSLFMYQSNYNQKQIKVKMGQTDSILTLHYVICLSEFSVSFDRLILSCQKYVSSTQQRFDVFLKYLKYLH